MAPEASVRPARVALGTGRLGHIEHDGDRQDVVGFRQRYQRFACLGLDIGGIDDHELAGFEALAGDEVQHLKGGAGGRLVVLVVRDKRAAGVRRQDLGRGEVAGGEAGLARARDPHQSDQREVGERDLGHRENTAIWVGWPSSSSSGPMPDSVTS